MRIHEEEKAVTVNCTHCDEQFQVREIMFEIYLGTQFCSRECEDTYIEEWR
jgi:hypothetical protein